MKFNDKILQLRNERKISQEELSEASGISIRTIQRIEKDEVNPRPYTARKLLEALNISLEDFNAESQNDSNFNIEENTKLNRFIISNFLVFLFPIIFLIPVIFIWKKGKWSNSSNIICKKILSFQVVWIIISVSITLLTPFFIKLFGGQNVVGQLFPTPILVYIALSFVDVFIVLRIAKSLKVSSSKWTSIIPNLF
ncbi:helix-turn-helix domain-containing protein [Winogradskyella luteola]|uniref:Helix-turn-helix transcriptional regulator n=1 Tax=Winogradskyella luteola TaxID=2828330 RepID=A0A9X1F5N8_9FLAO|nr:helix-turn-helix domain-containing protein [Winogradskyella luteola]MBV7267576.1 helix-turn-helix transcriptional regulator [Winogradskyella luteola]